MNTILQFCPLTPFLIKELNVFPDKKIILQVSCLIPVEEPGNEMCRHFPHLVPADWSPVSDRLHVVYNVISAAWDDSARHVSLHTEDPDVHLVPGDCLQHAHLRPLNVEAEVVDGGVAHGQQGRVERETLQPGGVLSRLWHQSCK